MPDFQYLGGDYGKGLLESALAQPQQTFNGCYLYRTIFDKAAILLYSMIKNHPFIDGNKRMALTTASVFLTLNEYVFYVPPDEAVERCIAIASITGGTNWREISSWLRTKSIKAEAYIDMLPERQERWLGNVPGALGYREQLVTIMKEILKLRGKQT